VIQVGGEYHTAKLGRLIRMCSCETCSVDIYLVRCLSIIIQKKGTLYHYCISTLLQNTLKKQEALW
jgi:hypothetical protein